MTLSSGGDVTTRTTRVRSRSMIYRSNCVCRPSPHFGYTARGMLGGRVTERPKCSYTHHADSAYIVSGQAGCSASQPPAYSSSLARSIWVITALHVVKQYNQSFRPLQFSSPA